MVNNYRLNVRGIDLPVIADIPISVNKSITDVRNPDTVKTDWTKTVSIPFSQEADLLFDLIFETNIETATFNPNLKETAEYFKDEISQLKGNLQLNRINRVYNGETISGTYECTIYGQGNDIFSEFGNGYISDIDYSDLDHAFTYSGSYFTPSFIGEGVAYGFIDYGFNNGLNNSWKWTDLKVMVFAREILRRMFVDVGYTWSSNFLDGTYFRHLIVPDVNEGRMKQSPDLIEDAQFYVGVPALATGVFVSQGGSYIPNAVYYPALGQNDVAGYSFNFMNISPVPTGVTGLIPYTDDSASPWYDTGGVFNTGTAIFTSNLTSTYVLSATNYFKVFLTNYGAAASMVGTLNVYVTFEIQYNGGGGWGQNGNTLAQSTTLVQITNLTQFTSSNLVQTVPWQIPVNGQCRVVVRMQVLNTVILKDGGGVSLTGLTPNIQIDISASSTFFGKVADSTLLYGQTVIVGNSIPQLVKKKDFFKYFIQKYNLRIEPTIDNPYILKIEPHNTFYAGTTNDWTNKWDISKGEVIIPMGEQAAKSYLFTDKADVDCANTTYQDEYKLNYGSKILNITNDFLTNQNKTETIVSPTPMVGNIFNNMIVGKLYKTDDGTINGTAKVTKCNMRVLYWGGLKNCTPYSWDINGTVTQATTYPFVGHTDDPQTPTLDTGWFYPNKLYYNYGALTFTTNNAYNAYWSQFMTEITDPNSKIVKRWMFLTENDIKNFTFRSLVFIEDAYFYVNKINNFNPTVDASCEVELLKTKPATAFVGVQIDGVGVGGGGVGGEYGIYYQPAGDNMMGNYQNGGGVALGQNNNNQGVGFVGGENNIIQ